MWSEILSFGLISRYGYGVLSILAFVLGSFVFWKKGREEHFDEYELVDLVLILVIWGLVGARAAYIITHFHEFGLNILYWLSLWSKPGLYWIGMLAASGLFLYRFCRTHKWDFFRITDLIVIGASLSQALLNLGIFLSANALGTTTNLPIGILFPGSFEKRHPIGLYAFLLWMICFTLLWWFEKKYRRFVWYQKHKGDALPGFLTFVYLIMFGLIGTLITPLSESNFVYLGINIDLIVSISFIFIGSAGLIIRSGLSNKLSSYIPIKLHH